MLFIIVWYYCTKIDGIYFTLRESSDIGTFNFRWFCLPGISLALVYRFVKKKLISSSIFNVDILNVSLQKEFLSFIVVFVKE